MRWLIDHFVKWSSGCISAGFRVGGYHEKSGNSTTCLPSPTTFTPPASPAGGSETVRGAVRTPHFSHTPSTCRTDHRQRLSHQRSGLTSHRQKLRQRPGLTPYTASTCDTPPAPEIARTCVSLHHTPASANTASTYASFAHRQKLWQSSYTTSTCVSVKG